jgi:glycosyltransferase involved in cell wall biosynthesis
VTLDYSVVIPAYNAAATIRQAIDSVLRQTVGPQGIVVVDDGSTDETATVVSSISGPIVLIRQDNGGPGAATTAGLARIDAPFVATLDADDLWLPTKIARQAICFEKDPELAAVFTLARCFFDGQPPDPEGPGAVVRLWTRTTLLFRSEAARGVGAVIDLPGRLGEIVDWLARSRDLGHRHTMVEEILALRRIRRGSLSYDRDPDRNRGYLVAVHAALERRRLRHGKGTGPTSDG